jgi:hypothetical protein
VHFNSTTRSQRLPDRMPCAVSCSKQEMLSSGGAGG